MITRRHGSCYSPLGSRASSKLSIPRNDEDAAIIALTLTGVQTPPSENASGPELMDLISAGPEVSG